MGVTAAVAILVIVSAFAYSVGGRDYFAFANPDNGQNGTTLDVKIDKINTTTSIEWTKTFNWTIAKTVNEVSNLVLNLFRGDSAEAEYTVSVTKEDGSEQYKVSGEVCVTNGGAVETQGLAINVELKKLPDPVQGDTYKVTANVKITNHSGAIGENHVTPDSSTFVMPQGPTLVNDSVTVTDTNTEGNPPWNFSVTGSQTYKKTFSCDENSAASTDYPNTATLSTGPSASASVKVNCYKLSVVPDPVTTSFDRTYHWGISKSADRSSLTLAVNQDPVPVNYTVTVTQLPYVDSNWTASGSVTVTNSAPIPATINSISDLITLGNIQPTLNCGVTSWPYIMAAGDSLTCTYTVSLPNADPRTNTFTATMQNFSYDSANVATPTDTTNFVATQNFDFSAATINKIDETVSVSDSLQGALGTVSDTETSPKVFNYTRMVSGPETCGESNISNTATFTTNDTSATGSANWNVAVHSPCNQGCTLTIGYWKNHAGFGPQVDMLTTPLPVDLGTLFPKGIHVTTPVQAVGLLGYSGDASNGINKVYGQLLAAKLNILSGASNTSIASIISTVDAFLNTKNSLDWSSLTKAQKSYVNSWVGALDNYNNGVTGPGHCTQ